MGTTNGRQTTSGFFGVAVQTLRQARLVFSLLQVLQVMSDQHPVWCRINSWNRYGNPWVSSQNDLLVGGDWNHGILNDFPLLLGME